MDMEYEIVREFDTNGKHMVVVKIGENAHVMDESELKWVYGQLHPERWKKGA